jgi:predicted enzyme related to lactoylglutathione lyase
MTTAAQVGITGIDAAYYLTKDLNAATTFYSTLLGFEPTMHAPDTVSEWTFKSGESFGIYQPQNAADWHPSGGVLFAVTDFEASIAACKAIGVKFEDHPMETPMCHMAFGEDPEGNTFIIHKQK